MAWSSAEVILAQAGHVIAARATDVISTKTSDATAIEAVHVAASVEATHVTTAEAATTVSSASAATASSGLCTRGNKAAGKHCAGKNHHHSSSHDILHLSGRTFRRPIRRWRASAR